jgi:hypothetical protein
MVVNGQAQVIEARCDGALACLGSCPRGALKVTSRPELVCPSASAIAKCLEPATNPNQGLINWPIKIGLINPVNAFSGYSELLVAADCVGFALSDFRQFQANRPVLIGCPKLDDVDDYARKLTNVLKNHPDLRRVTVAMMTVPCCQGLKWAVDEAVKMAERDLSVASQRISQAGHVQL